MRLFFVNQPPAAGTGGSQTGGGTCDFVSVATTTPTTPGSSARTIRSAWPITRTDALEMQKPLRVSSQDAVEIAG